MIDFILNGKKVSYSGGELKLLEWLRNFQNIKSVKDGCSGQGVCGACLVEIDGKPKLSCSVPMEKLHGANILTLEGFPGEVKLTLGRAFVASGAVQCGFCSPGMLSRAKMLLDKNPNPNQEEIIKAIKPNLCRCTGYVKIVDAIMLATQSINSRKNIEFDKDKFGLSAPKYNGLERVLGSPLFVDDLHYDNMAFGALRFSDHPRAKVLRIDTSKAEVVKGVLKVLTAKDVPAERYLGLVVKDWPIYIAEGETTKYIGDVLACIVASSEKIAREALQLINIEYEVCEPLTNAKLAAESNIKIHAKGNILKETHICYGNNINDIFESSEYVVSNKFETQLVEHAFLETEASLALYENGFITLYSQSQGIYEDREQIAAMLGLDKKRVIVKLVPAGGAFGGKEDLTVQGHAALAAYYLHRPVKIKLNRFESIGMHPKRHPMYMEYKLSCDKEGKFTGLYARILGDTGAYASVGGPVMERAATHAGGAYFIPNIDVKSTAVYTNNLVAGAMRGFGVNQVTFAIESLIDELCEKGGFDRWEIRYKNALEKGLTTTSGHRLRKEVGLKKALEIVKKEYQNSKFTGIACGIKNCGVGNGIPEVSQVKLEVLNDGGIKLYHGWSEMGQGIDTVVRQILCEAIGLDDPPQIEVVVSTEYETKGGSTTASRGTFLAGKAVLDAAYRLKKDMEKHQLKNLAGKIYNGEYICDWTTPSNFKGEVISHFAYSFAVQLVSLSNEGKIEKVIAVHDSGKIANKKLFEGQIEGGVVMGLGYALTESLVLDKGRIADNRFGKLGLLRSSDVPAIEVISTDIYDEDAPFGAKGVGEISCIPTAAAVASAYRKLDGKKRTKLPLEPIDLKNV